MHNEDFILEQGTQGNIVEDHGEQPRDVAIEFVPCFSLDADGGEKKREREAVSKSAWSRVGRSRDAGTDLEAINLRHILRLMIAPAQVKTRRIQDLVGKERKNNLHGEGSSIHEVAVEEVRSRIARCTVNFEDVQ